MSTFLTHYIEKLKLSCMDDTYLSILFQAWNYHLSPLLPSHFFIPSPEKYVPYFCNPAFYPVSYESLLIRAFYVSKGFQDGSLWTVEYRNRTWCSVFSPSTSSPSRSPSHHHCKVFLKNFFHCISPLLNPTVLHFSYSKPRILLKFWVPHLQRCPLSLSASVSSYSWMSAFP